MSWFNFKKKVDRHTPYPISGFPIFSELQSADIRMIEKKVRLHEVKKGEMVYQRGESAQAFFLILTGRFRVMGEDGNLINYLHPGEYFGETSILTNSSHSATVEAQNDSIVYQIAREDFVELVKEIPSLSLHISRTLGRRLMGRLDGDEATAGAAKLISFWHVEKGIGCSMLANHFAFFLTRESAKRVVLIHVEVGSEEADLKRNHRKLLDLSQFDLSASDRLKEFVEEGRESFDTLAVCGGNDAEKNLGLLLACLLSRYEYIVIDLPHSPMEIHTLLRKAIQQSDLVYLVISKPELFQEATGAMIQDLKRSVGLMQDQIRMVVRQEKSAIHEEFDWDMAQRIGLIFATFSYTQRLAGKDPYSREGIEEPDLTCKYFRTARFLARISAGCAVGLVLGSGAAFGYAHVGVLKVLEEEKIEIDMISASSMGAVIGCLWAAGLSAARLVEILKTLDNRTTFFRLFGFSDLSMVHRGFFKGEQVVRFLREHLDELTFRDLQTPVKVVATDLASGSPIFFDEGMLLYAIRASISIPGIFRPYFYQGRFLIDGGIAEPLPVQILSRYGIKKIIAVNVLQSPEHHLERLKLMEKRAEKADAILRKKNVITQAIYEKRKRSAQEKSANIFNVLMKTIEFMEYGMAESASQQADITLRPVVSDSHWAEFFAHGKFVRCGEEEARRHIGEIRDLIRN